MGDTNCFGREVMGYMYISYPGEMSTVSKVGECVLRLPVDCHHNTQR